MRGIHGDAGAGASRFREELDLNVGEKKDRQTRKHLSDSLRCSCLLILCALQKKGVKDKP